MDAGIKNRIGCYTFRAIGITIYLTNGGDLEKAQQMAAHDKPADDQAEGAHRARRAQIMVKNLLGSRETCLELLTLGPTMVDPPASKYNERWEEQT